jgi:hypothetical protein
MARKVSQLLATEQDVEYRVHQDPYKCIQLAFRGEPTVDYRYGTWGQTKNCQVQTILSTERIRPEKVS